MRTDADILELLDRFKKSCEKHLAEFLEDNKKGKTSYCVNWADLSVVDVEFRISENGGELQYTLACLIEEGQDRTFDALMASRVQPDWDGYYVEIKTEW